VAARITSADHLEVLDLALEQRPREAVETAQIVVPTDSAAATHDLTDELAAAKINFLMGLDLTEPRPPSDPRPVRDGPPLPGHAHRPRRRRRAA